MIIPFFKKIVYQINQHAEKTGNPYIAFGIFGVITYPLYYFIWAYTNTQGYENLTLRLIAAFLCVPLIFKEKLPKKILRLLPIYWYLTLLYSLPFLFTFLILKNGLSYPWVLNGMTVVVLSVLLLDLIPLLIILPIGIIGGVTCFKLTSTENIASYDNLPVIIITYLSVIFFGAVFARRKEGIQQGKLNAAYTVGASIAHELRTPIRTVQMTFR